MSEKSTNTNPTVISVTKIGDVRTEVPTVKCVPPPPPPTKVKK